MTLYFAIYFLITSCNRVTEIILQKCVLNVTAYCFIVICCLFFSHTFPLGVIITIVNCLSVFRNAVIVFMRGSMGSGNGLKEIIGFGYLLLGGLSKTVE